MTADFEARKKRDRETAWLNALFLAMEEEAGETEDERHHNRLRTRIERLEAIVFDKKC